MQVRTFSINNVKEDQAIDKYLINYNLNINYLNTHHNKETKLHSVYASRLSWILRISEAGLLACFGVLSEVVWVSYAHIKREWDT